MKVVLNTIKQAKTNKHVNKILIKAVWYFFYFFNALCCKMLIFHARQSCVFIIPHWYVLLNTRFLLDLLDHVTCDYIWQYNLWWTHYWSCDKYDLAILTPSNKKNSRFHHLNFKKHNLSCQIMIIMIQTISNLELVNRLQ